MRLKDKLYMTPIRKYEKYGRFPWKMVIHLLLVVLTTCQVVLVVNQGTTYAFSQYSLWNSLFINHNIQGSTSPIVNSFMLFSSKHVTSFVETSVKRYYDINSHTIDNYEFNYLDDGTKKPPKLLVRYLDNASSLNKGYLIEYNLLPNDFGPFSDNADNFLDEVSDFDIEFNLIHEVNTYVETASNCYDWKITQKFDYSSHGIVIASLDTYRKSCHSEPFHVFERYVWLGILVFLLSSMSLWTVGRYFISQITWMAKLQGSGSASVWETLGIYEKFRFLDLWVLFTIIGNLFQMFGGILMLFEHVVVVNTLDAIIGLGCYFAWIGSLRFLNKTSQEATMTNTVNRSFGIIGPYIIGAVPIFMAYVFFAMCSFWETGLYPNTHMGMIAAFAVVNGDSVYAFGFAEYSQSAFIGMLFYFTFVVFFIWYALYSFVQNVFIAIIQVGYRSLQTEPPRQGDESSDEESPVPQELIIKKRKSPRNS